MRRDEIREAIRLRALGLLDAEELRVLDARLSEDNDAVEILREEQRLLEDFAALAETPPVDVDVRDAVMARVRDRRPQTVRAPRFQLVGAAAAGLFAAAGIGGVLWQMRSGVQAIGGTAGSAVGALLDAGWHATSSTATQYLASGGTGLPDWLPVAVGMAGACYAVLLAGATLVVGRDLRATMVRLSQSRR